MPIRISCKCGHIFYNETEGAGSSFKPPIKILKETYDEKTEKSLCPKCGRILDEEVKIIIGGSPDFYKLPEDYKPSTPIIDLREKMKKYRIEKRNTETHERKKNKKS